MPLKVGIDELTPNKARQLDKCLRFTDYVLSRPDVAAQTNAIALNIQVWLTICSYTDPFMDATVYSVPGVLPPNE